MTTLLPESLFGTIAAMLTICALFIDYTKYIHYENTRVMLIFGADQS